MRNLAIVTAVALSLTALVACSDIVTDDPLADVHDATTSQEKRVVATIAKAVELADASNPIVCDYYSRGFQNAVAADSKTQLPAELVKKFERDTGKPFSCRHAFALAESEDTNPLKFDEIRIVKELTPSSGEALGIAGVGDPGPQWVRIYVVRDQNSPTGWAIDGFVPDRDYNLDTQG